MIDIKKAKQEFKNYVKKYDINNPKIALKIAHIERTSQIARNLAKNLNLEKEDIELAELIGLLHDIGRFEQVRIYNTFSDKDSINHGELGAKILFEDGEIRRFIEEDRYDNIIKTAIVNHNRNRETMQWSNEKEELHSKIIRDADKIDILYILTFEEKKVAWGKADLSNEKITDEIYREFMNKESINYKKRETIADKLVSHFAFLYDFNYKYSLQIIKEKGYIDKIYERFKFNDSETENKYNNIYLNAKELLEIRGNNNEKNN